MVPLKEVYTYAFTIQTAANITSLAYAWQFLVGSGATWAGLWYWREDKISELIREYGDELKTPRCAKVGCH